MSDYIWLNGEIIPFSEARIGVEDRGFQFADGVYEVVRLYQGKPFTLSEHLDRLTRSAEAIRLSVPLAKNALAAEIGKLVARSGHRDGMVYLQLTRGCSPRNHVFPAEVKPTLLFYARPLPPPPVPG
ncbi:MAG: dat, partial [Phycisphaerales bacterium]|nr:dat [Phycisphaerales bacterium]